MSVGSERVADYLSHMDEAIGLARSFVDGLTKDDFLADRKTQQAVILNLIVLGEAAILLKRGSLWAQGDDRVWG